MLTLHFDDNVVFKSLWKSEGYGSILFNILKVSFVTPPEKLKISLAKAFESEHLIFNFEF